MTRKIILILSIFVVATLAIFLYFYSLSSNRLPVVTNQKVECYCSFCAGDCMETKFRENEECPLPPPENIAKCEESSCIVMNGKCMTVPKISK